MSVDERGGRRHYELISSSSSSCSLFLCVSGSAMSDRVDCLLYCLLYLCVCVCVCVCVSVQCQGSEAQEER